MNPLSINVHIGEVKTGSGHEELHTILGSCIGIGFIWKKRGIYGMAHCLLPRSPDTSYEIGGKFIDQAVHSLTQLMSIIDYREIRALVAGGANMTGGTTAEHTKMVGYLNAQAAISILEEHKIIIDLHDTGGTEGRKMSILCSTGDFKVKSIPRIIA